MKVLIYGLGSIAKKHIDQLKSLYPENLSVYALRSGGNNASQVDGVTNIYNESELITEPDFIIISNPTYLRAETLRRSLQFNKSLFIEKPSLFTLDASLEINNEIKRRNVLSYVACNLRFHPCILFLKEKVNECVSKVAEVNIYCGSYLPDWRSEPSDFRLNYSARKEMGGGVHLDLIHEIDYCCWIFGLPQHTRSCKRNRSYLKINSCDYANFLFEYESFAADITLNYFRRNRKRTIEVVTSEGTWLVDLIRNEVYFNDSLVKSFPNFNIMDTYKTQLIYFIRQIDNNKQPMNSFEESIGIMKIALS